MQNLETLCGAAQAFLNYDIAQGKWAVVINRPGASVASFDDSNIVGSISIQGTGLRDLYNTVRVEFPHIDLNDEYDFVEIAIPAGDRNANEPDNTLNIQFDCINDPVMAEMLGLIELKQSRVDRVITFDVDFSYLGLKAGDLIDVTSTLLGYTNKMFRIISINESDGSDGSLMMNITALEYDADVYDISDRTQAMYSKPQCRPASPSAMRRPLQHWVFPPWITPAGKRRTSSTYSAHSVCLRQSAGAKKAWSARVLKSWRVGPVRQRRNTQAQRSLLVC
jgi:hypothetical protein